MKHAALALAAVLYVLVWGQNWTWFAGALMLRAIVNDYRRESHGGNMGEIPSP